ncbi:MAG TPA: hypothetical protein PL185_02820 [Flavobacteriales bacterium]|nr:hypothetical protein [Flavobacteriales bacterium]
MRKLSRIFLVFICMTSLSLQAQDKIKTVGFQIKPLFFSSFFGTGPQSLSDSSYSYTLKPSSGYAAGMVIRQGYTPTLSIEFGINYVVRNVSITASHASQTASNSLRIIGYEIPFSQLIFIRLGEHTFMNAGAGICLNIFPSDVIKRDSTFAAYGGRKHSFVPSLLANIGVEYRTPKSGYFYFGASLNRPFGPIYNVAIDYIQNGIVQNSTLGSLNGSYLSADFKYFFPEDPEKKKVRKAKRKKEEPVVK